MAKPELNRLHATVTDLRTLVTSALMSLKQDDPAYNYYTQLLKVANKANVLVSDIKAIPEVVGGDIDYDALAEDLVLSGAVPDEFAKVVAQELVKNLEKRPEALKELPWAYMIGLFNYVHGNNPLGSKEFQKAIPKSHLWTQWI